MEGKQTTAVTVGVIISLLLMVVTLLLYFTNLYTKQWTQFIGFFILVLGIVYGVMNHAKERDHNVTFGNLFAYGFKIVAVITCLMIVYTVISGYIFPDVKERIIETAREQALAKPGVNEAQVEMGMDMFSKHYTLFIVLTILFWYLVLGCITSLIAAAITKKRPQNTFEKI